MQNHTSKRKLSLGWIMLLQLIPSAFLLKAWNQPCAASPLEAQVPQGSSILRPAFVETKRDSREGFADIIAPRLSAVVNISITHGYSRKRYGNGMSEFSLPEGPLGDVFRDFFGQPHFFGTTISKTNGSGVIISPDGLIVTNYHVIQNAPEQNIRVTLDSGEELAATVVGCDVRSDLALLKINPVRKLTALTWGNSQDMRVGDLILAIGNPFGLGGTVTSGIISHTKRNLPSRMIGDTTDDIDWLQIDAPINQGNSGGAIINMKGEVIGISTAIYAPTGVPMGIGLAIPSSIASVIVEELKEKGCVKRGWIGVKLGAPLTSVLSKDLNIKPLEGVLLDDVLPGKPADRAGIKVGDVILKMNHKPVRSPQQIRTLFSMLKPKETVVLTLWRKEGELQMDVPVVLDEEENAPNPPLNAEASPSFLLKQAKPILGLTLETLNKQTPSNPQGQGLLITKIDATSPFLVRHRPDDILPEPGDIILSVNLDSPIDSIEAFRDAIQEAKADAIRLQKTETTLLVLLKKQNQEKFHLSIRITDLKNSL